MWIFIIFSLFIFSGFIGFAASIYELLEKDSISDTYDDQLFYTQLFLNQNIREKLNIKLDSRAEIFLNLYGVHGGFILVCCVSIFLYFLSGSRVGCV